MPTTPAAPLVSVIIPSYNHAHLVGTAIESALSTAGVALEVIVVDDGSVDDTASVVRTYDSRVRYVRQSNGGHGEARNTGHREARGAYVAWLDSDDIAEPGRFRMQAELLTRYSSVALVSTGFSAFNEAGTVWDSYAEHYYGVIAREGLAALFEHTDSVELGGLEGSMRATFHHGQLYPRLVFSNFVHPPTVMMRKEVWHAAGPLDQQFATATDWEFFVRASRLFAFGYLDLPLLRYRRSVGQQTDDANVRRNIPREMHALEAMRRADPALDGERARLGALYRHWHLAMANASASDDRAGALKSLLRSLGHGIDPRAFLVAASRIAAPRALRPMLGRIRRAIRRG